jgi:hypothetical protein
MKNLFLFLICLCVTQLRSQKHDHFWTFGYDHTNVDPFGTMLLNFNTSPPSIIKQNLNAEFDIGCTACADTFGQLAFYSNMGRIYNKDFQLMDNGDTINPGQVWNNSANFGYLGIGGMAIPAPGQVNQYYLFHLATHIDVNYSPPVVFAPLYFSLIDMNLNNGKGKVVKKNINILSTYQTQQSLVKHANGRDWWLVTAKESEPLYYVFLISPKGIEGPFEQNIGPLFQQQEGIGYSGFSPDGSHYVRTDLFSGIYIFDFDRCSGLLGNLRIVPYDSSFHFLAHTFSSDSRYLYLSNPTEILQFDMNYIDSTISIIDTIAIYDKFIDPEPIYRTRFDDLQLCADNKIYGPCYSQTSGRLHVIHHPELPGLSADMEQHGIKLPRYNGWTICYSPNYRLGKLDGSNCDTLGYVFPPKLNLGSKFKTIVFNNLTIDSKSKPFNQNKMPIDLNHRIYERFLIFEKKYKQFQYENLPKY